MDIEAIREFLDEEAVIINGLDEAILGYSDTGLLIYDFERSVAVFMECGMARDEAIEWIEFNVLGIQDNGAGFVMRYEC
tara:strand:- start:513 stop:749 length:237 start_codon:yes stop_codon:yes gene_type:complete